MAWTQRVFAATVRGQIDWVAITRARFEASSGIQDSTNEFWVDWQMAMADEAKLRREYFDAYGTPYDEKFAA